VRDLLFPSPPPLRAALRSAARVGAAAFAAECRAITAMLGAAEPEQQEFVAGEVGCVLHIAPATAMSRVGTALAICAQPRLLTGLDHGQLSVGQARALLDEIRHLTPSTPPQFWTRSWAATRRRSWTRPRVSCARR